MREEDLGRGKRIGGLVAMRKFVPFEADAGSGGLGWVGLEAARYSEVPALEMDLPPLTHHALILLPRPPEELDVLYEGVKRHVPTPAGSVLLVPAGSPSLWGLSGRFDSLLIYLEPSLVARVPAEAFDLAPSRPTVPPRIGLDLPH